MVKFPRKTNTKESDPEDTGQENTGNYGEEEEPVFKKEIYKDKKISSVG